MSELTDKHFFLLAPIVKANVTITTNIEPLENMFFISNVIGTYRKKVLTRIGLKNLVAKFLTTNVKVEFKNFPGERLGSIHG